jgi:hypothetical protein
MFINMLEVCVMTTHIYDLIFKYISGQKIKEFGDWRVGTLPDSAVYFISRDTILTSRVNDVKSEHILSLVAWFYTQEKIRLGLDNKMQALPIIYKLLISLILIISFLYKNRLNHSILFYAGVTEEHCLRYITPLLIV